MVEHILQVLAADSLLSAIERFLVILMEDSIIENKNKVLKKINYNIRVIDRKIGIILGCLGILIFIMFLNFIIK